MSNEVVKPATSAHPEERAPILKLLVELGPLVVFFLVNSQAGRFIEDPKRAIFWGTGAFMIATVVALVASRALFGRVPMMPLISGFFVVVFGGLTLLLNDDLFIKMKPTIVNLVFAGILLGGLAFGQALLRHLFDQVFRLTETGWRKLTLRWSLFFVFLAVLNEVIWRNFSTDFWVAFKVFGIMPLTIVFAVLQLGLIKRHEQRPAA
jgi:intracellular septation protein